MSEKNVCSNGWQGVHGTTVTLKNDNSKPVTVSSDPNCAWPFQSPSSPFTIKAKVGSTPGTQVVQLVNTPGTYCYRTNGCPDDMKVNPKTVIIT